MSFSFNFSLENESIDGDTVVISNDFVDTSAKTNNNSNASLIGNQNSFKSDKFDLVEVILNYNANRENLSNECIRIPIENYEHLMSKEVSRISTQGGDLFKLCFPYNNIANNNNISIGNELSGTDLIPGFYEGGLKTWECSVDLCNYLLNHVTEGDIKSSTRILELGCGSGLPGICCMMNFEYHSIVFVDYNVDVIENVTWPNIIYNLKYAEQNNTYSSRCKDEVLERAVSDMEVTSNGLNDDDMKGCDHACTDMLQKIHCFAGDWMQLESHPPIAPFDCELIPKYDIILSAETLYNTDTCKEIGQLLFKHLSFPNGTAYISSKRYYFGVGGGTSDFKTVLSNMPVPLPSSNTDGINIGDKSMGCTYRWNIEVVEEIQDKASNLREILKITFVYTNSCK